MSTTLDRTLDLFPNPKQYLAWQALNDPKIAEVHYGGAAGGGKSWLGAESRLVRAIAYPGYKSFIGRNELKRLMATSYITFQKVCKYHKIAPEDWHLNGQYNYIEFRNGSRIDLLDLSYKPSDPMYERLGSLEYTDAGWIDEAGEIPFMAIDIIQTRGGRHMNDEFGIRPDTLYTYNPNKGWVYRVYKQWKEGTLPEDVVFIQAFYTDNEHTREIYGAQLDRIKDPGMRARLKLGSFEYDADPTRLIDNDAAVDLFTNTVEDDKTKAISVDVARHGVDKTVKYLWKGWTIYGVRIYAKQDTAITSTKLKTTAEEEQTAYSRIIVDEDGIGGGVMDQCKGVQGFIANSPALPNPESPEDKENYANLKSQCSYVLADKINTHKMAIKIEPGQFRSEVDGITEEVWKDMLLEELDYVKAKHTVADTKLRVISKEEIKEQLGRSPDFLDTAMMRARLDYPSKLKLKGVSIHKPQSGGFRRR